MITVSPSTVDFGALAPGESATEIVKTSEAPADAQVIATIVGDDAASFNVNTLSSYEWVLEPVDPGELPPGFKGHPKQRVLELAGQTDGKTPLSVSEGQLVHVEIVAIAPTQSDKLNLRARLFIQGDTWGDPVAVDLSLLRGQVDIAPDSLEVTIRDEQPGSIKFTLQLISGNSTFVIFEPANWNADAVVTITSDKPGNSFSVGPGNTVAPAPLRISLNGPIQSGFFHLAATAFEVVDDRFRSDAFRVRAAAERERPGLPNVLRIIVCPFQGQGAFGLTEGGTLDDKTFQDFILINANKMRSDKMTVLHEMIHAATGLTEIDHDADPDSVFSTSSTRGVLKREHAKALSQAFFALQ